MTNASAVQKQKAPGLQSTHLMINMEVIAEKQEHEN